MRILSLLLLLGACTSSPKFEPDPYQGTWWLGKLNGKVIPTAPPAPRPSLTIQEQRLSLTLGCNRFNGTWPAPGKLLGPQASTRMACPPHLAELEQQYVDLSARVNDYRIAQGRLQWLADGEVVLEAFRTPDQQRLKELDATWKLVKLKGQTEIHGLFDERAPYLVLELAAGKAHGNSGCNQFFASATVAGDAIWLAPAGTTLVACPPAQDGQERRMMRYFEQADRTELRNDSLTWWQGDTLLMTFQRDRQQAEP